MNGVQRVDLIDKIAIELQSRYTFDQIDLFLSGYRIKYPGNSSNYNSKRTYSREALAGEDDSLLVTIAQDLNLDISSNAVHKITIPPKMWDNSSEFRLFISHLASHKEKAVKLKNALKSYHISSFVAHEDITPTLLWQSEIERALGSMDAMICIHTAGFSKSYWTQQEIGFALGRNIKIMSLRMEEDPTGFISKQQAILRRGRDAKGVAEEINSILINDPMTKDKMKEVRSCYNKNKEDDEIPF